MYSVFHFLIPKRFKSLRNKTENVRCKLLEKVALSYFVTIFLLKKLVFCCGNWRFRMNPLFFITMCSIDLVNSVQSLSLSSLALSHIKEFNVLTGQFAEHI